MTLDERIAIARQRLSEGDSGHVRSTLVPSPARKRSGPLSASELTDRIAAARLVVDPELRKLATEHLEQQRSQQEWERLTRAGNGRKSGWQEGTPQCHSCRRILSGYGAWCPDCRHYSDRWRG